jgi:hypothetical protein
MENLSQEDFPELEHLHCSSNKGEKKKVWKIVIKSFNRKIVAYQSITNYHLDSLKTQTSPQLFANK